MEKINEIDNKEILEHFTKFLSYILGTIIDKKDKHLINNEFILRMILDYYKVFKVLAITIKEDYINEIKKLN